MYSVHLHKLSDSPPQPEPVHLLSPVPQRQPVQPEPELLPVRMPELPLHAVPLLLPLKSVISETRHKLFYPLYCGCISFIFCPEEVLFK